MSSSPINITSKRQHDALQVEQDIAGGSVWSGMAKEINDSGIAWIEIMPQMFNSPCTKAEYLLINQILTITVG